MRHFSFALIFSTIFTLSAYAAAPCDNSLPAPQSVVATSVPDDPLTPTLNEAAINVRWMPVSGATKYAVEVVAKYASCSTSQHFEFVIGAVSTSIRVPLEKIKLCSGKKCVSSLPAQAATVRVKALNPPQGEEKQAQCNPFSAACTVDVCGDHIDGDCDGMVDEDCDADGDGYVTGSGAGSCAPGGDCNDNDPLIHPGVADLSCPADGIDNDCDGAIDEDACPITIVKRTNGEDANTPPGPTIRAGGPVGWTYTVTNISTGTLNKVGVGDDQGVTVTCPKTKLLASESMVCSGSGTAIPGDYSNIGTASATISSGARVSATDPSHYHGAVAAISVQTLTNGYDADTPPGPSILSGSPVLWTYVVTNIGELTLNGVIVTDDQGVAVTCPKTTLASSESMTCTASGIAQAGQYANIGSVSATPSTGKPTVTAKNSSHYLGLTASLRMDTLIGSDDADVAPGPAIVVGTSVPLLYRVANDGDVTMFSVAINDDHGLTVYCPKTSLMSGESMTCTASQVLAVYGQNAHVGTASGTPSGGAQITVSDPANYFGIHATASIALEMLTNGIHATSYPGATTMYSSSVTWTYHVTNDGAETLNPVTVTDSSSVTVTCPKATLVPGESMTCTACKTTASYGDLHSNIGTARGKPSGTEVQSTDSGHFYNGIERLNATIVAASGNPSGSGCVTQLESDTDLNPVEGSLRLWVLSEIPLSALAELSVTYNFPTGEYRFGTPAFLLSVDTDHNGLPDVNVSCSLSTELFEAGHTEYVKFNAIGDTEARWTTNGDKHTFAEILELLPDATILQAWFVVRGSAWNVHQIVNVDQFTVNQYKYVSQCPCQ